MDTVSLKNFLKQRLTTAELMQQAAEHIGVSVATMYRYKANPEAIPLGKLVALGKHVGFPISGSVAWSKANVLDSERRRLELESNVTNPQGRRYMVAPSFTVNCELPEFTARLWDFDYGARNLSDLQDYIATRAQRRQIYESGKYESFELFVGAGYRDFFKREGRFTGISEELRDKQLERVLRSLEFSHVHRRIYLKNTPELPIFTCYSSDIAVIRVDDFTVEFNDRDIAKELIEIYNNYFDSADLKTRDDVRDFLISPT